MLDHNVNVLDQAPVETIGQLVALDFRKASVFRKYGIDFCCGGNKTVAEACIKKGIDSSKVEEELGKLDMQQGTRSLPYHDWGIDFLATYIVNTHHRYVTKALPDLLALSNKVSKVHGAGHPELIQIRQIVESVASELTSHMFKEEKVLFPYITRLAEARSGTATFMGSHFGTVRNPINMMEAEHEHVGEAMAEIRKLTNQYVLPEGACTSYRVLYQMLEAFEEDLHVHVHLENNILFPKAEAVEKELGW